MMKIGFIGLGIMGLPMAKRLVDDGYQVVGHNRSRPAVDAFEQHGGTGVASLAEAVRDRDVVITMLPAGPDVETVMFGEDGVLEHVAPGTVIIDMSTIEPQVSRDLADRAGARGCTALDAPVSGGEQGAIDGRLSIMVGGDADAFEKVRPVLDVLGATVTYLGPAGAGQTVKAANQLMVALHLGAAAEALTVLESLEVDVAAAVRVLSAGLAGSAVLDQKHEMMRAREYTPGFRLALHHKDMGIALTMAREAEVSTPLSALAAQQIASMVAQGHGDYDHGGVKFLVDQSSGRL